MRTNLTLDFIYLSLCCYFSFCVRINVIISLTLFFDCIDFSIKYESFNMFNSFIDLAPKASHHVALMV